MSSPEAKHTEGPWEVWPSLYVGMAAAVVKNVEPLRTLAEVRDFRDARLIAAAPDQNVAAREIDRLMLVIESAVRNADPAHHAAVLAALKANRAAIAKAAGQ